MEKKTTEKNLNNFIYVFTMQVSRKAYWVNCNSHFLANYPGKPGLPDPNILRLV